MTPNAPLRPVHMGSIEALAERRADGSILIRRKEPLGSYPDKLTERFVHWAQTAPDRVFFGQLDAAGQLRHLSYAETFTKIRSIGQALIDRKLSLERPLVVLSENDIENGLIALAAMYVGVPCAPLSPSYSLLATDYTKLRFILGKLNPGLVFAASGTRYAKAIRAVLPGKTEVVVAQDPPEDRAVTLFDSLVATRPTDAVEAAYRRVGPDTIAKILYTSGSTGFPKGVLFPQSMMCSNQQGLAQAFAFLLDEPPVLVDWLPWHHTFGGTNNLGIAIYCGGSFYIDRGKPMPGLIEPMLQILKQVSPTVYFTAPKGLEALIPHLRSDEVLRKSYFRRLKALEYGGSTMPAHVLDAFDELAVQTYGERVMVVSGIGSTEAGPSTVIANWDIGKQPIIGLPSSGIETKLVPNGPKLEMRLRGPSIMPSYWREEELTRESFDEEGFFKIGDAVTFIEPDHPEMGLVFDGRVTEDFKLSSGTWVNVGALRDRLINFCAPLVRDAVIAGHNGDFVSAIVFPNFDACRELAPSLPKSASAEDIVANPQVRAHFEQLLKKMAAPGGGSSSRIARIVLEPDWPLLDTGEVTDKASLSARAVLERRASVVKELHAVTPGPRLIRADA